MGVEGMVSKHRESTYPGRPAAELGQGEEPAASSVWPGAGSVWLAKFSRLTDGCVLECGVCFHQLRTCGAAMGQSRHSAFGRALVAVTFSMSASATDKWHWRCDGASLERFSDSRCRIPAASYSEWAPDPCAGVELFRAGSPEQSLTCTVGVGAGLRVDEAGPKFANSGRSTRKRGIVPEFFS